MILSKKTIRCIYPALLALVFAAGGCAYKIEIKQGDERLLSELDNLRTGMSQDEVRQLLGPPRARLFKKNIWHYSYQLREAGFIDDMRMMSVELVFDDDGLVQEVKVLRNDYADEAGDDDN